MAEPYSLVDELGQYLASIVARPGRNEVQFYPLCGGGEQLIDEAQITRHELQSGLDIVAATWLNEHADAPAGPKGQKRAAPGETSTQAGTQAQAENSTQTRDSTQTKDSTQAKDSTQTDTQTQTQPQTDTQPQTEAPAEPLLAVALALGEIWTFLPRRAVRVAQACVPEPAVSLAAAHARNHVWACGAAGLVFLVDVVGGAVAKTIRVSRVLAEPCAMVAACRHQARRRRNTAPPQLFFAALASLRLMDGARLRGYVVAEFAARDDGADDARRPISHVAPVPGDGRAVAVARAGSGAVSLFDVAAPAQPPVVLPCGSLDVRRLRAWRGGYVVAFTARGAEVFLLHAAAPAEPVAVVRAAGPGVVLENVFLSAAHGVVGVFYAGTQPRFVRVAAAAAALAGDVSVPAGDVSGVASGDVSGIAPAIAPETIPGFASETISETAPADARLDGALLAELVVRLGAQPPEPAAVVAVCAGCAHEPTIRAVVCLLGQHADRTLVPALFEAVAGHVARDPARSDPLAVWLRWVLLAHGGRLAGARQHADSLRALQRSLAAGVPMMGRMLALQGRLLMLKAQAELRRGGGLVAPELDSELDAVLAAGGALALPQWPAEAVVYANGENDDSEGFEDGLEGGLEDGLEGDLEGDHEGGRGADAALGPDA